MKQFFKNLLKVFFACLLLLAVMVFIGVMLPAKTFKQKDEQITHLFIKGCNIVDVINGTIISNTNVLVTHGKIIAIDTLLPLLTPNVKTVDGRGKYLMPSLWDMHIHTLSLSPQLHFPLLIANGVTGIRDLGDGDSWISSLDDSTERDKAIWAKLKKDDGLLVPKIPEATSYHVEELEDFNQTNYKLKVVELIATLKARGEPFVKVQLENATIPGYIFYELQQEAKRQGIPILGHLSGNLDVNRVLENGFKSIEHAWALIPHCVQQKKPFDKDIDQKSYDLNHQDTGVTRQVLEKIAAAGTYYVPTHVTSNRKEFLAFDSHFNRDSNTAYTEYVQLGLWKLVNWLHTKGYDKKTDLPILKSYYQRGLQITKLAHTSGVKLLAGTDALDRNVFYGISLHKELEEMVSAGLTNAEALQTATSNAAQYYGLSGSYGSIEIGKTADFILLNKNPLENIAHTRTIEGVFYDERWYSKDDLEQMKNFVKTQARSFGVSCKFIWNMIKRD